MLFDFNKQTVIYSMLKEISPGGPHNHITIESDTPTHENFEMLRLIGMIKGGRPETKTVIRKLKLDPRKHYVSYWIGSGCSGHNFIKWYEGKYS